MRGIEGESWETGQSYRLAHLGLLWRVELAHGFEIHVFAPDAAGGLEVEYIICQRHVGRHAMVAERDEPAFLDFGF